MLEELHGSKYVEHSTLLHPIRKTQKLCGSRCVGAFSFPFLIKNLDHALGRNGEILFIERLFIFNYDEVVRTEHGGGNLLAVAVKEFDWHVSTMFCEETYGLIPSLDGLNHVPNGSIFSYEISFSKFSNLVVSLAFVSFNNISEVIKLERIFGLIVVSCFFLFFVVVLVSLVPLNLRHAGNGVSIHVVVELSVFHFFWDHGLAGSRLKRSELGRVDDSRSDFPSNLV